MKFQFIANACVLVEHKGISVLCDPWFFDGAYYGSWCHYPPLELVPEDFLHVDYIYISHIHPDHMQVESLERFPRNIKIIILEYEEKFLHRLLQRLGFENIIEISHRGSLQLSSDFSIQLLAADNCDPILCNKNFGCKVSQFYEKTLQIDSLAVFHSDDKTIVNSNDCPYELSYSVCDYINKKYEKIDILLVGYNGASEYPQCYDNYDEEEKMKKADEIRFKNLNRSVGYLKHLSPDFFVPFAGQYFLGGKLAHLNKYTMHLDMQELPKLYDEILPKHKVTSKLVLLNSGTWFDLDTNEQSKPFEEVDIQKREHYIDNILSKRKFTYELVEYDTTTDLFSKLVDAQANMYSRTEKLYGTKLKRHLYLDVGEDFLYCIPFDGGQVEKQPVEMELKEPFFRITIDKVLLYMILDKKAHWNNAEIGSHLRYLRVPDVFESGFHQYLSYLHC